MDKLVTIRLHGILADKYGRLHRLNIHSPREAIAALEANYPGFRRDFLAHDNYALFVDGEWRDEANTPMVEASAVNVSIDFCPVVEGRIMTPIIAGLGLIGITGTAATIIAGVITVGLLLGVSLLFAPKVKKKTTEDTPKDENYMFSGPVNVTTQGAAVPLLYGHVFTGSVVVSAGLETTEDVGSTPNSWSWQRAAVFAAFNELMVSDVPQAPPPEPPLPFIPPGRTRPRYVPENG